MPVVCTAGDVVEQLIHGFIQRLVGIEVARRLDITTTTLYAYVNGDGTLKQAGQKI